MSKLNIVHPEENHFFLKVPHVAETMDRCKRNGEPFVFVLKKEDEEEISGKITMYTISEGHLRHEMTLKTNFEKMKIGLPCTIEKLVSIVSAAERYGI